jgi:hypothetical protein
MAKSGNGRGANRGGKRGATTGGGSKGGAKKAGGTSGKSTKTPKVNPTAPSDTLKPGSPPHTSGG